MTNTLSGYRFSRYYRQLDPLIKDKRTRAYWLVILSLLTISFFGIFAVRPTLKTISTLRRQIDDLTLLDTQLEEKINTLIDAQESYMEVEPLLPLVYSLLPQNADFPRLLRHLELLADDNNASISSIQVEPVSIYSSDESEVAVEIMPEEIEADEDTQTPKDPTMPLVVNFTVKGNYTDIINFLTRLTKIDRIISIETLNLTQDTSSSSLLSLNVKANALYFFEKSNLSSNIQVDTESQ